MMLTQFKTSRKRTTISKHFLSMLLMLSLALVVSCGDDTTGTSTTTTTTTTTTSPNTLTLTADGTSVLTNGTDSVTITATVLQNFAPVENADVTFSTTGGQISSTTGTTDANGQAQITFTSGPSQLNQTVTITATEASIGSQIIPIQITGSTLSISVIGPTNIAVADTTQLTVTAKDANNVGVNNATINYSIVATSTGSATLSTATDTTNVSGQSTITITGASVGTVDLVASGLGATATQSIIVGATAATFGITVPTVDPASFQLGSTLTVTVNAPTSADVEFITSVGTWDGAVNPVVTKPVAGVATAVLESTLAGIATIQVRDPANINLNDSLQVAISAPASQAFSLNLQASKTNIAPSSGGTTNTLTIEATVLNSSNQVVGNAPIYFTLNNPSGGGEYISPVLVYTDPTGKATTTFHAGTSSTDSLGVDVYATVLGSIPIINDFETIIVGGTAGSVVIGTSTLIQKDGSGTIYSFPISVLVADANGNPVEGALVSLNLWPTRYRTGYLDIDDQVLWTYYPINATTYDWVFPTEDINRSLTLDGTEDLPLLPYPHPGQNDGLLTPANSAAGNIPSSVTTGTNGTATFNITYLTNYAIWTEAEIKATTLVFGSETSASQTFWLGIAVGDEPNLPRLSPYTSETYTGYILVDPIECDATTTPPGIYSNPISYPNCPFIAAFP